MKARWRVLFAAVALAPLAPAAALGAELTGEREEVSYVAGSGEVNDARIEFESATEVLVSDPGASIFASDDCETVAAGQARCASERPFSGAIVRLGDGRDSLSLDAGDAEEPFEASVGSGAGADAVHLLGDARGTVTGDAGADELTGGASVDWLDGGPGDDAVLGEAGPDRVVGGRGGDQLFGGAGDDRVLSSEAPHADQQDVVGCGAGFDVVRTAKGSRGGQSADYLTTDCERVRAGLLGKLIGVPPRPLERRRISLAAPCPRRSRLDCSGRLTATANGRVLARGTATLPRGSLTSIRAPLTRAGRRVASRGGAALIRMSVQVGWAPPGAARPVYRRATVLLLVPVR